MKYKKGDRVVFTDNKEYRYRELLNKEGTVLDVSFKDGRELLTVKFDYSYLKTRKLYAFRLTFLSGEYLKNTILRKIDLMWNRQPYVEKQHG